MIFWFTAKGADGLIYWRLIKQKYTSAVTSHNVTAVSSF